MNIVSTVQQESAEVQLITQATERGGGMLRGGVSSFVARLSHLSIDHASLSRRSTVPTPNRDTSNIWALITIVPCIT